MYVKLLLCEINKEYLFIKSYNSVGDAIKYLKKLYYSPHIRCVDYKADFDNDSEIQYWYGRQVQFIMPIISSVLEWELHRKGDKKKL